MAVFLVKTFGLVLTAAHLATLDAAVLAFCPGRVYEGARQSGSTPKKEPVPTYLRFAVLVLASLALAATTLAQIPVMLPEFQASTSPPGDNDANSVTLGDDGRFIVTWIEFGETNSEVIGRRFDPPDAPMGDPFQLNEFTPNYQQNSSVARDASGRFVAVWADDQNTSIRGRRFAADGTPLGGNFQVSTFTPTSMTYPHVASDPSGNFVVAWMRFAGAGGVGIARRFDSNGAPLSDEFPINVFTPGFKNLSGVAMSPSGFVVSWFGALPPAGNGSSAYAIFARRFDADGNPMTGAWRSIPPHSWASTAGRTSP